MILLNVHIIQLKRENRLLAEPRDDFNWRFVFFSIALIMKNIFGYRYVHVYKRILFGKLFFGALSIKIFRLQYSYWVFLSSLLIYFETEWETKLELCYWVATWFIGFSAVNFSILHKLLFTFALIVCLNIIYLIIMSCEWLIWCHF